jgi:hypothetical protein
MQSKVKYGLMAIGSAVLGAILFTTYAAKAADKGGATKAVAVAAAPANPWSGCGLGAHAGFLVGALDFGAPVKIGADGPAFGVDASCDMQMGRGVIGIAVNYSWLHGDLKSVGINAEYGVAGRAGYLIWPSLLAYIKAGWSRVDTDGGDVDGYKVGGGMEVRLPDAPIFIALEYQRGFYADVLGLTGLDAETHTVVLRTTYKFNLMPR